MVTPDLRASRKEPMTLSNYFYLSGSICFAVGTLINMIRG